MLLDESEDMFTQDAWLGMKKCAGFCPVLPVSSRVVLCRTAWMFPIAVAPMASQNANLTHVGVQTCGLWSIRRFSL